MRFDRQLSRRAVLASSVGVVGAAALGGTLCRATAAEGESGDWIELFDGKSLAGWHKNPEKIGHGTGGHWAAEGGGALAGEQDPPGSGNGGILLTDRKFGEFELSLDLKPTWNIDSGVFLRCTDLGQCFQSMVDYYDGGSIGQFYGEGIGGWGARAFSLKGKVEDGELVSLSTIDHADPADVGLDYSCKPEEWVEAWKVADWNNLVVRVEGGALPRITTHINGLKVGVIDTAKFKGENFDGEEITKTLGTEGSIAVQVHGGGRYPAGAKTRFRNIRVREL
jgi:hypothetical protein